MPEANVPEIKLGGVKDKQNADELAELYAIIKTTEYLEKAFTKDACGDEKSYQDACSKLISQFKASERSLLSSGLIENVPKFMAKYRMNCPKGVHRLLHTGHPEFTSRPDEISQAATVAEVVQHFITAMDALELKSREIDEVQPLISDLLHSLKKVQGLPPDFACLEKLEAWLANLNSMRAADSISDEQARQLQFDLDSGHTSFHRFLKKY